MPDASSSLRVPKQQRAIERRQLIVESAALAFEQDGFTKTTLADISFQAGATSGSIYFHFRNKQELALAIITDQNEHTFRVLADALNEFSGPEGLIVGSKRFADLLLTDPVVRAGIRLSLEQSTLAAETAQFYRDWLTRLETTYRDLQLRGDVRDDMSPRALSRATVPFFTGVHLVSEMVDNWASLYEDLVGMWEVLISSIAPAAQHDSLREAARAQFAGPQPPLARNRRLMSEVSANAPDMNTPSMSASISKVANNSPSR